MGFGRHTSTAILVAYDKTLRGEAAGEGPDGDELRDRSADVERETGPTSAGMRFGSWSIVDKSERREVS